MEKLTGLQEAELSDKVALFFGWKAQEYYRRADHGMGFLLWSDPEGVTHSGGHPNYTVDMHACIKELVPKMKQICIHNYDIKMRGWHDCDTIDQGYYWVILVDGEEVVGLQSPESKPGCIMVYENPALALCAAIARLAEIKGY